LAEETVDPREVAWHPRICPQVVGHDHARASFVAAFDAGKPHHAWMITGPQGIGKASFAYALARHVLSQSMPADQVDRWVRARAHPDLAVLERSLNDAKPRKLRAEISVEDVRSFIDVFSRTSGGGGWRIGLVDAADDLNTESANALLKLVEEPPAKALIFLLCHAPGKLLRTLRSRCRKLPLGALTQQETLLILNGLPLEPPVESQELERTSAISQGRPGFALQLLQNQGAKAFQLFGAAKRLDASTRNAIGQHFASRATAPQDFQVFMDLLMDWLAKRTASTLDTDMAALHAELLRQQAISDGYNLDRRSAVMDALARIDDALKAA
jgi:DNA polymerase III subunit delta'